METALTISEKPLLRGVSHEFAFFVALGASGVLVAFAPFGKGTAAAAVYGGTLMFMLGASALYHRLPAAQSVKVWLERMDHSAIFVFIAGTYTPFCLVIGSQGTLLLSTIWAAAALGVARALFWVGAPRALSVALYLLVGWAVVPFLPALWRAIGPSGVVLLAIGGGIYSAGAVVFALKRPNPFPGVFGFHEVFHAAVILASALHFVAVARAITHLS